MTDPIRNDLRGTDIWVYRAAPLRVVDGDTIYVHVDHGMRVYSVQSLRLQDIDAPEIFRGSEEEKAAGQEAKTFVEEWIESLPDDPWPLLIRTERDKQSFNRYVAVVQRVDTGEFLGNALVFAEHAERV